MHFESLRIWMIPEPSLKTGNAIYCKVNVNYSNLCHVGFASSSLAVICKMRKTKQETFEQLIMMAKSVQQATKRLTTKAAYARQMSERYVVDRIVLEKN